MNLYKKAEDRVRKEQNRQLKMLNCTCFIVLYQMGWDVDKIIKRFDDTTDVWKECRNRKISTFELLEEETGIELALDGEKSYHDFAQFSRTERKVDIPEYIYSLHRRVRWIPPMILACLMISLHRVDGWDEDELADFIIRTDAVRKECGEEVSAYVEYMKKTTGYSPNLWGE